MLLNVTLVSYTHLLHVTIPFNGASLTQVATLTLTHHALSHPPTETVTNAMEVTSAGLSIQDVRAVSVSTKDVDLTSFSALFSSRYDATWRTAGDLHRRRVVHLAARTHGLNSRAARMTRCAEGLEQDANQE